METPKWLERTELLLKEDGQQKLRNANILIVGLGGVGSFAAEFIARAGVGSMTIVDGDDVDITNINRQLPALHSTVGKMKADVVAERLLDINPDLKLTVIKKFLSPEEAFEIVTPEFNYVLDCIDSVTPKLNLIMAGLRKKVKVVSSMGAGGKLDPSKVEVKDISRVRDCTLARSIKKQLKKNGFHKGVRCVFSSEIQDKESVFRTDGSNFKKSFYGTVSYMPALFGLYAAAEVINKLLEKQEEL